MRITGRAAWAAILGFSLFWFGLGFGIGHAEQTEVIVKQVYVPGVCGGGPPHPPQSQ